MKHIFFALLCCSWICFSGCGEKLPSNFPKVYPMTVKVTDGATPLPQMRVIFYHIGSDGSYASSGTTNDNGVAKVSTALGGFYKAGLPAGEFVVTVEDIIDISTGVPPEEQIKMSIPELNKLTEEQRKKVAEYQRKAPVVLCQKGSVEQRSPIRFNTTEGKNELTIDVAEYK